MPSKTAQRPRSKSILSFGSNKSGDSGGKIDLTETAKEKSSRRMTSKADPTLAMNELQPGKPSWARWLFQLCFLHDNSITQCLTERPANSGVSCYRS
jgi:hypothetical protein